MDSDQRRKRKRGLRTPFRGQYFSVRSSMLCFLFFLILLHLLSTERFRFLFGLSFRPVVSVSYSSLLSSSSATAMNSIQDSVYSESMPLRVEDRISFTDHMLLLVSNGVHRSKNLDCVYSCLLNCSGCERNRKLVQSVFSVDEYDEFRTIVRCPLPPLNYSAAVSLRRRGDAGESNWPLPVNQTVHSWERVAYAAALDGETVSVFVKGLNLRPDRESDPKSFRCHFGLGNQQRDGGFVLTTKAITAAQEVVRCWLPRSIRANPNKAQGIRVTVSHVQPIVQGRRVASVHVHMPSAARISKFDREKRKINQGKYGLCACTMVWNQASSLREWIMYHAWLGIERWFIYDNNSDDGIKEVIEELDSEAYNVTRHSWPWTKTQEAGFSHCALRARDECKWVAFMDVDEFFFFQFPTRRHRGIGFPLQNSLRTLVSNFSSSTTIGEIRTTCHSFGPSGLSSPPSQGATVGYTCRLQRPERHKSIIRPDVLDSTLLNVVHHFRLKKGFRYMNVPQSIAVINHYKYQVWEAFRAKFFRRVATYVVDWQRNQNEGSKDRAPGLGTEAIEPPNWPHQFCEVWDTGLRDFVLANLADPATGLLPWEKSL